MIVILNEEEFADNPTYSLELSIYDSVIIQREDGLCFSVNKINNIFNKEASWVIERVKEKIKKENA